jgi:hypothetical protein
MVNFPYPSNIIESVLAQELSVNGETLQNGVNEEHLNDKTEALISDAKISTEYTPEFLENPTAWTLNNTAYVVEGAGTLVIIFLLFCNDMVGIRGH